MRLSLGNVPDNQGEPPESEEWHRIHSPSSRLGYLLAGLAGLAFPFVLIGWLIVVSLLAGGTEAQDVAANAPTPRGAELLALLLYIPLHELLHAVWHPQLGLSSRTVLVIWPKRLRFGVYFEGCMTRRRWLVMRMAPLMVLSIIPAVLLAFFNFFPVSFALEIFLQVLLLVNGIGSGGDIVAVIWVLRQVPSKTQICFFGGKAYWKPVADHS